MRGCVEIGDGAVLCGVTRDNPTRRHVRHCWNCGRRRRMASLFGGVWYGDFTICLGCGEEWSGGEHVPRPFRPRWRQENMAHARQWWDRALTPREYRAFVLTELDYALSPNEAAS